MADNEIMLTTGLKRCTWTPMERQTTPFGRGGGIVVELGYPYWMIDFEYANLLDDDWRELTAWVARRRGAVQSLSCHAAGSKERSNVLHGLGGG